MGDDNRGFSKLNEETSVHGSVFQTSTPIEGYGLHNGTRINLGFGRCLKLRVKAERDEGSLRIGGLALAANCHHIVLIFGFFFLLAGAVLTSLAYKAKPELDNTVSVTPREEGKVAGPLFCVIGSTLIIVGVGLTIVGWKVNQEAKRQLNHFSLQTPPPPTPDTQDYLSAFANLQQSNFFSRSGSSSQCSRRESMFTSNFFPDRRRTLPTIAQAVPLGFFMDGKLSGAPESSSMSTRLHSPESFQADKRNGDSKEFETDRSLDFNQSTLHRKASLSLRPSLPIPIIASPSFIRSRVIAPLDPNCLIRTRSDEPFGSIVSLSGTGDIACFPAAPPTLFAPCLEEDLPSCENVSEANVATLSPVSSRQLPTIQVNECSNSFPSQL